MVNSIRAQLKTSLLMLGLFALVTGVIYPLGVTGIAQVIFPNKADGSVVEDNQGSRLIGQPFSAPKYFWSRPSAVNYDASTSSGSNLGPTSADLINNVESQVQALQAADPTNDAPIPVDLVTASGSGLDPHISVAAARYQAPRVARARELELELVYDLIDEYTEERQFGIFGESRVTVLELNLALDQLTPNGD